MHHLNSGELKLFNVAEDYAEQNDLAVKMPKKVAEMDRIRQQYVDEVDGGKMEDVYAAYFDFLDENQGNSEKRYLENSEKLKQKKPADFEAQKAKLDAAWEEEKRKCYVQREICKAQMTNKSWRETDKIDVTKKLGIDKQGNIIPKKGNKIKKN